MKGRDAFHDSEAKMTRQTVDHQIRPPSRRSRCLTGSTTTQGARLRRQKVETAGKNRAVVRSVTMGSNSIRTGRYRHFKGNEYIVIGVARHSDTGEELVVYRQDYDDRSLWVRPKDMVL